MRPANNRHFWLFILAGSLLSGSLLAGCRAASPPLPASPNLLPAEGSTPAATMPVIGLAPTATPQAEGSTQFLPALENQNPGDPTGTQLPMEDPTATPPASRKEIKAGLEASDPNAAQLASGDIQLIEFFAFW